VKRSPTVHLTLMATMALVACGGPRQCVDETGRVVPDSFCSTPPARGGYHWYSGGSRTFVGTGRPASSSSAPSSHGVSRGGFGSTGGANAGS